MGTGVGDTIMAMDVNNGERLLASILDSARAEAEAILAQAKSRAEAQAAEAGREAARIGQEAAAKAEAARQDVLERSRTNAELEGRKDALAHKRAVLEEAFGQALTELCALSGQAREALLVKLLLENAEGGETVSPALADEGALGALLSEVNAKLARKGKAPLTMGPAREGIAGGFCLTGPSYELNCSFEALLRDLRESEVGGVAKILFGER